jgi:hypothetical protein
MGSIMHEDHCIDSELMDHLDLANDLFTDISWDDEDPIWIQAATDWKIRYNELLEKFFETQEARSD